mgnify:CR=1 FL=1
MDAFAVSICKGLKMKVIDLKQSFIIAFFFGAFQLMMPLIGYALSASFVEYINKYSHWIAFVLLLVIGVNMIREALGDSEEEKEVIESVTDFKELFMLAIATSIDALAVGVTFAFLQVDIIPAVSFIGVITFLISFAGVKIGNVFGVRYKKKDEITGGVILILLGVKILIEHLGLI